MKSIETYLHAHRARAVDELAELVRFRSISARADHASELRACAEWLAAHLERIGLEHVDVLETSGNPVVYGDWLHAPAGAPTALLYGHYDVQPPDPVERWSSPPFEPEIRDGRMYGRGVSDEKAQIFANLKALEARLAVAGGLDCNVKVIVEGDEENRPESIEDVARDHAVLLAADLAVISDSGVFARDVPSVAIGLRGMAALEVTLRTGAGDLHSGVYGGAAPNAAHAVAALAAGLHDASGRVAIEGFYDRVRPVGDEERAAWARLPFDERAYLDAIGASALVGEPEYPPIERLLGRPTLDVHGIWSGFQDPGVKTIIPAEAHLKLSCRLVPDQDAEEVAALLRRHVERNAPPWATVEVDLSLAGAWPILTPAGHPAVRAALASLREGFGRDALTVRSGWSVPVAAILKRELDLDSVLLGFGLPTDGMHAPDEHVELELFHRGISTMAAFWPRLAEEWEAAA